MAIEHPKGCPAPHYPAAVRVCDESDIECLRGCGTNACKKSTASVAPQAAGDGEFKNFHRLLCDRFGYVHDEKDWKRDQLSLIEWIAAGQRMRDSASLYIWFAEDHGQARNGDHYIRAWTADPTKVPALQESIGREPLVYIRQCMSDAASEASEIIEQASYKRGFNEGREVGWKEQRMSDAAISACALMIKGICMTLPQDQWSRKIEERIRFMLSSQAEK